MDNLSFKSRVIEAAGSGGAIITPTGRLARQLRHRVRLGLGPEGRGGFSLPPDAVSLNSWLKRAYLSSWPSLAPATGLQCLRHAARATEEVPPPGELMPGLALGELLDEAYGTLAKNGLLGEGRPYATELLEWRERAFSAYEGLLEESRLLHPLFLASEVTALIEKGELKPEKGVVLAGLRPAARTEARLLDALVRERGAVPVDLPRGSLAGARAFALPDRWQEVRWVVEEILRHGANHAHHRLAVVTTNDRVYHPMFRQCLEETARCPAGGRQLAFNVSAPGPVLGHPLCRAALLPVELCLGGEPEEKLFSLFMSPYYGAWPEKRRLSLSRKVWAEKNITRGLAPLMEALSGAPDVAAAAAPEGRPDITDLPGMLDPGERASFAQRALRLKEVWRGLGFPVVAGEEDEIAASHLFEVLDELSSALKGEGTDPTGFYLWLKKGLERRLMAPAREETAGFQVIGRIEALGLWFDRVWVAGLTHEDLPGRPSVNPLLAPEERRAVAEANHRGRHLIARDDFSNWLAAGREVVLTRPQTVERDPAMPSPFWPGEEVEARMDLWARPGPGWLRAGWLRRGWEGLTAPRRPASHREEQPLSGFTPKELSVSELESFLGCPFRYFGRWVLGAEPLPEPVLGLHPRERGVIIHRILSSFTRRVRELGLEPHGDHDRCLAVLREEVARFTADAGPGGPLRMEAARLLGDREVQGVLVLWLLEEAGRWAEGYRWVCEEEPFSGLDIPGAGCTLRGRVDRIDRDPGGRAVLWDYKTGGIPGRKDVTEEFTEPQLPLYLMAHRAGLLGAEGDAGAGYICLNFEDRGASRLLVKAEDRSEVLAGLGEFILKRARKLQEGDFRPDPHPERDLKKKPCQHCEFKGACGVWTMEEP